MEPATQDANQPSTSKSSTPTVSRRSSANRLKLHKYRSNSSLKLGFSGLTPSTPPDEQSLTSFPSLSPAIEASPEIFSINADRPTIDNTLAESVNLQSALQIPSAIKELFSPASPTSQSGEHPALFDDAPIGIRNIPGTLHHQSDENVERLIAKQGAVRLVKQLAQDLAERDAQITLIQRRAEERESLLRKMLRDCEISNLDIENRLRELRKARDEQDGKDSGRASLRRNSLKHVDAFGTRPEASIGERLAEAVSDAFNVDDDMLGNRLTIAASGHANGMSTVRGPRNPSLHSADTRSLASKASMQSQRSGGMQDFKEYLKFATGMGKDSINSQTQMDGLTQLSGEEEPRLARTQSNTVSPSPTTASRNGSHVATPRNDSTAYRDRTPSNGGSEATVSSISMAGWMTRLVAGGTKSTVKKPRAATVSAVPVGDRNLAKPPPLQKTKSRNDVNSNMGNRASSSHSGTSTYNSSGTVRKVAQDSRKSVPGVLPVTAIDTANGSVTNLGPVEMDTILPEDTRPPTLVQYNNYGSSAEFLTDRFGFIYDQRRRRRQNEAAEALPHSKRGEIVEALKKQQKPGLAAANAETTSNQSRRSRTSSLQGASRPDTPTSLEDQSDEQPNKRWQDYLKLSSFRTELLSHTPYAAPITDIITGEGQAEPQGKSSQILVSKRGTEPERSANPPPAPTRAVSENAEIAQLSTSEVSAPTFHPRPAPDPVKSLLDHVNDVHDALQRDRTIKWNDFLRKVRAERRRDGEQAIVSGTRSKTLAMPESQLMDGEVIGVAGLGIKGKTGRAKGVEFRNLVLSGIPVAYRAKIWAECCGALTLKIPGYYEELVNSSFNDPVIAQQIQMDITRTLTDNIFFRKGQGIQKLNEVLLAYARRNPDVGYCQGMNLITANLLLIMPAAEDAFWILTAIVETILPARYYDSSLLTSRADQVVLRLYVGEVLPQLSSHLENLGIDLEAVTFQWFLSVFTDCLSAEALFRVWDVVLCLNDGSTFLFQVALALLKLNEKSLLACESPAEVYGYINQRMTDHAISIDGLIRASEGLKNEVKRDDIVKRRQSAVDAEEEMALQREAVRKGKRKVPLEVETAAEQLALVSGQAVAQQQQQKRNTVNRSSSSSSALLHNGHGHGHGHGHDVIHDIGKERSGKLTRQSSRANLSLHYDDDEEYEGWGGELQVRTPMPIDEEALWRA